MVSSTENKTNAQLEAMTVFNFLQGQWKGQKIEDCVVTGICQDIGRYEVGGGAFTVAGQSFDLTGSLLQMENFGVFSYDKLRSCYTLTAHANEKVMQGKVDVLKDGSIEVYPQGEESSVRLTMIPESSSSWREIGEQRDGSNGKWMPLFEIHFHRIE